MDCQMDYTDPNVYYTSSQYGYFDRTVNNWVSHDDITPPDVDGEGEWITPLIIHPTTPQTLLAGYNHVWASYDAGDSWMDISPNLPTTANMHRLSMSPADNDRIFGLWNDNRLRYSPDFGNTWTNINHVFANQISDIHADPKNKDVLWVTLSGYGGPRVSRYTIGGTWANQTGSLPDVPANCFIKDSSNNTLYVGTDIGVFYRDTATNQWAPYANGLPTIDVQDLAINYATSEVWAATYGRGLWKSPRQKDSVVVEEPSSIELLVPYAHNVITVAPNPSNGQFTIITDNEALRGQSVSVVLSSYDGKRTSPVTARFDGGGKLTLTSAAVANGLYIVEVWKDGIPFAKTKIVIQSQTM